MRIDLAQPTIVFLTVCAKNREPWMAQCCVEEALTRIWRNQAKAWPAGRYLIMPDHIHLFCAPYDLRFTLEKWVAFWKSCFSREHLAQEWVWQDTIGTRGCGTRNINAERWLYVRENPVRKGLVTRMEDWPFTGRFISCRGNLAGRCNPGRATFHRRPNLF